MFATTAPRQRQQSARKLSKDLRKSLRVIIFSFFKFALLSAQLLELRGFLISFAIRYIFSLFLFLPFYSSFLLLFCLCFNVAQYNLLLLSKANALSNLENYISRSKPKSKKPKEPKSKEEVVKPLKKGKGKKAASLKPPLESKDKILASTLYSCSCSALLVYSCSSSARLSTSRGRACSCK